MTIYRDLLALGYSDQELRLAGSTQALGASFGLFFLDTPDGEPVVGISYSTDYRSEEESGGASILRAMAIRDDIWTIAPDALSYFARFQDAPSLIISSSQLKRPLYRWGENIESLTGYIGPSYRADESRRIRFCYDASYNYALPNIQGIPSEYNLNHLSVAKIRQLGKSLGLRGMPRKRVELVDFLGSSKEYIALGKSKNIWPGWFHTGRVLVLKASTGLMADVLNLIYLSTRRVSTRVELGSGLEQGRVIRIYDGADLGPLERKRRLELIDWTESAILEGKSTADHLNENGYEVSFLGDPIQYKVGDEIVAKYFANIKSKATNRIWRHGYYTLQELLADSKVNDSSHLICR